MNEIQRVIHMYEADELTKEEAHDAIGHIVVEHMPVMWDLDTVMDFDK
ncbi:hypothetical protein BPS13_0181 [Bacillus phage BPS13]|uniref:Uncharacterized protein n=1 Tax=Bacillus phage BPS13 TaxID=1136731 RepID=J9PV33_9CAUD|nr:hypothetical protein BPS13_0181 [Bacillus phage BPS13]AEZ50360.1 hypothetical protein BPS13_0181 [Bacillus phage BPS13]